MVSSIGQKACEGNDGPPHQGMLGRRDQGTEAAPSGGTVGLTRLLEGRKSTVTRN